MRISNLPELTKEEFGQAIKQGVKEAFTEVLVNGQTEAGGLISEAISEGVISAIPCIREADLKDLIYAGIKDAHAGR